MNLDCKIWREIIQSFVYISFEASHDYIVLDEYNIREEANFIISSEL